MSEFVPYIPFIPIIVWMTIVGYNLNRHEFPTEIGGEETDPQ